MPPKPASAAGAGRQRTHVSIFDRRGQTPNRNRAQTGKGTGNNTSFNQGAGHRTAAGGHGDDTSLHGAPVFFNKVCMLRVHEDAFSTSDLVVNASFFPGIRVGDIVSIRPLADGDDGDLVSPRGSFDVNDATTGASVAAAAAGAADGCAGAPQGAAPGAGANANAGLVSAASSVWAADSATAGEGAGTSVRKASAGPEAKTAGTKRSADMDKHRLCAGAGGSGSTANLPKQPNRWMGVSEHDRMLFTGASERTDDDDTDLPFKPTPHCEILLQVGEVRRDAQQLQASVLTSVARALWGDYQTNQRVAIRKVNIENAAERDAVRADFVEIAFRDQYVGRSDMWRLWRVLSQKIVHANKPTNIDGLIRASVRRIYKDNVQVPCGFIDASTQAIFRSESGRFIIFIQMSEEMWEYQEDGNLCFEKAVNCFLAELFRRWSDKQLNHMVTIVMFSRWYYHIRDSLYFQDLIYDENTERYYRDYYKVIADMEVRPDWTVFLPEILSEFNSYRRDIQELVSSAGHRLRGDLSRASQGNILEAINLGMNSFASNHVDRDLSRTGLSTVVITPSFGVFDVDKDLLRMTTERMLHFGLRVDLVCLAPKPLFRPPVFRFRSIPVPSEQEQRRALQNRRLAKEESEKAKAAEFSSISPRAESPGAYINTGGSGSGSNVGQSAGLAKDRGAKAMANAKPENVVAVDPIMLDPLYFDGDAWENELLPFLLGARPRSGVGGTGSREPRLGAWQSGGSSGSRASNAERLADGGRGRQGGSAVNALLNSMDSAIDNIPDTIKELSLDDYPFFAGGRRAFAMDRRVTYCYFPYWVDCGFYNYTDELASERADAFRPSCRMGTLSVDGASTYLQTAPGIPDVELRAMDTELASLLGLESRRVSAPGSPPGLQRSRDEDASSADMAHPAAMPKDGHHGRSVRLAAVPEHDALLELFDKFDRRAIVGTGVTTGAHAGDMLASTADLASDVLGSLHTGVRSAAGSADPRLAATPGVIYASHSSAGPSNASAYWEEPGAEAGDRRAAPAVSTSASPNLIHGHGQAPRPPGRADKGAAVSSSVPREAKLNASTGLAAVVPQRASVFGRSNGGGSGGSTAAQRKRPPQQQQPAAEGGESNEAEMTVTMAAAAMAAAASAGSAKWRGSGSPQSLSRVPLAAGGHSRRASDAMLPESMAKQAHLDDHIRTFRGGTAEAAGQPMQRAPPGVRQSALASALLGDAPDFQLTLPAGRQAAGVFRPAPSQPSAPSDVRHASPQHGRTVWLSERHSLGTHVQDPGQRSVRGRSYALYNPCNPSLSPLPHTELSQRWAMAFPTYWLLSSFTPKWRSLCTPASLPLVTDFQPSDLGTFYSRFNYFVQTPDLADGAVSLPADCLEDREEFAQFVTALGHVDRSTLVMLREMVYQRLAQGFQFINHGGGGGGGGRAARLGRMKPGAAAAAPPAGILSSGMAAAAADKSVWLSNGRQIQQLEVHAGGESGHMPGVGVTRWERNRLFAQGNLAYRFQMWSRNSAMGYRAADLSFAYPRSEDVNWNNLDFLIFGYQTKLARSMKYWRARYILIPVDQLGNDTIVSAKGNPALSVEDVRIANFEKFLDHILRLLGREDRARLEARFLGALPEAMRRTHERQQQQQPRQPPAADAAKTIGLGSLTPSALMQIRFTTLYPVPYLVNQLYYYMSDAIYLDPTKPIALPPPAALLGLGESLNVESPFAQLAHALQHPRGGVSLRNIRWHYVDLDAVFAGYQLVDWILVNFDSVVKRSQAVAAGGRLMDRGLVVSAQGQAAFMDGHHFYAFADAAVACRAAGASHGQRVARYSGGAGSGNPSPSVSRPASRQGSGTPSLAGDADAPVAGRKHGQARESARESSSESWAGGPQPASKLRVRTDTPAGVVSEPASAEPPEPPGHAHPAPPPLLPARMSAYGRLGENAAAAAAAASSAPGSAAPSPVGLGAVEYRRTPEVFPRLSGRRSKRPLPKNLPQSRTFTLDLDQQRRSTRIENCIVHLDAVQNPMTCFHLSINWLNCTNFLVDELVRGWSRMAERCGMRLVEAPRAQDTTVEDSHPFHSPIPIELALAPPSVQRIFDDAWVADFGYFGETDSEPETSSDEDEEEEEHATPDALDWVYAEERATRRRRARTLRRMCKCIPSYPFERELLEEQDFILDVEAEDAFPDSKMLHREYTFERQGYEHTQYVHRSGTAFVQICGPGRFLWINNYLFTSHMNHPRQTQHQGLATAPSQMSLGSYGNVGAAPNPAAVLASASDMSAVSTPLSSSSRQTTRPPPSQQQQQQQQQPPPVGKPVDPASSDAYPLVTPTSGTSGSRMVPAFYPMRHTREMWPHQIHKSLAMHKLPHRKFEIPEWYSLQVVDSLGTLLADFDSVNAAITRVAVMRQVDGPSPLGSSVRPGDVSAGSDDMLFWKNEGQSPSLASGQVASPAYNEGRGEWVGGSATPPAQNSAAQPSSSSSAGETNPDVLRANFIEVCRDQNSLEMLWQQTIGRYRNAWRTYHASQMPDNESPKSRPMVVDMFSEGMWQNRKPGP